MTLHQFTNEDLTRVANQVKEALLLGLLARKEITEEEYYRFGTLYAIIIHEPGLLGSLIDKLLGHKEGLRISLMQAALVDNKNEGDA